MKMSIDLKKYKRFFAFGCSFTSYCWPTWADLVSKEMPNAIFYNLGQPGAGNQYISYMIAEANQKYQFNKDDLVIILWSTFLREDRYIDDQWITNGNIYNNPLYDDYFLKKYVDHKGFIYRDLAHMELSTGYLSNKCDFYNLLSVPPYEESETPNNSKKRYIDIETKFLSLVKNFPKSMYELEFSEGWVTEYSKDIDSGHPTTIRYFSFLEKLGFNLSETTRQYAEECTKFLQNAKTKSEVIAHFEHHYIDVKRN